ncbi:hypothetical protein ACQKFM_11010 [Paenibacillus xylanexedens]
MGINEALVFAVRIHANTNASFVGSAHLLMEPITPETLEGEQPSSLTGAT